MGALNLKSPSAESSNANAVKGMQYRLTIKEISYRDRFAKNWLMHKREIMKLFGLVKQDGYALVPCPYILRGAG
jgi:tmRNA-binding protein